MAEDTTTPDRRGAWKVAAGLAIGLLVWFGVANSSSVQVHFWVRTIDAPLIVVVMVSALLGALILALWQQARRRH